MFSNFIPPWTLFSPTLDKIITRSISYLPTVYIYFLRRCSFLLSVASQFSDPLARDQVQTNERSQTAISQALGDIPTLFTSCSIPPWPIFLVLWHVPLSPPLFTGALHLRLVANTSARLVRCSSVWAHSFQHILHTLQAGLRGTTETYGVGVILLPNSWS